ncbi:MAG TPA: hypothetical protein VE735_06440 [Gammaproteobacteria bacterium]|nr:hypothetical protein [Gammaproteobacteria bacterium]
MDQIVNRLAAQISDVSCLNKRPTFSDQEHRLNATKETCLDSLG